MPLQLLLPLWLTASQPLPLAFGSATALSLTARSYTLASPPLMTGSATSGFRSVRTATSAPDATPRATASAAELRQRFGSASAVASAVSAGSPSCGSILATTPAPLCAVRARRRPRPVSENAALCPECEGRGSVPATPGQPGDGPEPCPACSELTRCSEECWRSGWCDKACERPGAVAVPRPKPDAAYSGRNDEGDQRHQAALGRPDRDAAEGLADRLQGHEEVAPDGGSAALSRGRVG